MKTKLVESPITKYLYEKSARAGIPLSGTFELTPCCNMACKMCYVRKTRAEQEAIGRLRTKEEWLELGQKAKEAGMLYLLITGGEPFLYPEIREVLSGLQKMGLVISINTNGTMIDEEIVDWLKECAPSRFNITLYGASDETYEKLCGNPKGFTQVKRAIRLLKEAGFVLKINCSVTPHNVQDLEAIFAFCEKEELVLQATSYMFPSEQAQNVFEMEFSKAWENLKQESSVVRLSAKCSRCSLKKSCRACAAMAITESGSFDKVPEYRCLMSKNYAAACERLLQEMKDRKESAI